jgi:PadR family transcriptional regulator PadR
MLCWFGWTPTPPVSSLDNLGEAIVRSIPRLSREDPKMRNDRTDLMQGTLELLILKTLAREQMHGYGIAQRIHEAVDDLLRVEDGSLYPALYRMEERGWISSEWGVSENNRRAKFYKLTRSGRQQLAAQSVNWERISKAVMRVLQAT